jgi:hypothetical protein
MIRYREKKSMDTPAGDWVALAALAFTLGLKHGLDADHLATIDGLTRFNARARPAMARWCGALFSLGHGAVVVVVAVTVGTGVLGGGLSSLSLQPARSAAGSARIANLRPSLVQCRRW